MMMRHRIAASILALIAVAAAGAATAQNGGGMAGGGMGGGRMMGQGGGGGALRGACREDVEQLCAGVQPGGGRIAQCLRDHQDRVSEGCKSAIASAGSQRHGSQDDMSKAPPPSPN
jgi:hypothetical protein